jgi:hypothetical protein
MIFDGIISQNMLSIKRCKTNIKYSDKYHFDIGFKAKIIQFFTVTEIPAHCNYAYNSLGKNVLKAL